MPEYIVTVKLPKNPEHNPRDKKTGLCPMHYQCTDVTGEHHSYLTFAKDAQRAREVAEKVYGHVTRIEGPVA